MSYPSRSYRTLGFMALIAVAMLGCPIRTEHKVETTHKIEAHIVIDVRKVQQEAEQIESEVRGGETPKAEPDPGSRTGAMVAWPSDAFTVAATPVASPPRGFWSIFDISTRAAAAENEEAAAIARRKARAGRINAELSRGCFGENNRGYVELRPCDAAKEASERSALQSLADEENRDRRTVYSAIAVREGLRADQADAIGEIFAGEIRKRLSSGQSFQVPARDSHYEEFLKTEMARSLRQPRPGTWVQVP
jgi:uncharacterized protein YdbL (DUF1318 family)